MEHKPDWLQLAIQVEDVALRLLAERHPDRPLKTNVEFYAAPVLMGVGLTPGPLPGDVLAGPPRRLDRPRPRAGGLNRLIRPDVRYVGPAERDLPT